MFEIGNKLRIVLPQEPNYLDIELLIVIGIKLQHFYHTSSSLTWFL